MFLYVEFMHKQYIGIENKTYIYKYELISKRGFFFYTYMPAWMMEKGKNM